MLESIWVHLGQGLHGLQLWQRHAAPRCRPEDEPAPYRVENWSDSRTLAVRFRGHPQTFADSQGSSDQEVPDMGQVHY